MGSREERHSVDLSFRGSAIVPLYPSLQRHRKYLGGWGSDSSCEIPTATYFMHVGYQILGQSVKSSDDC